MLVPTEIASSGGSITLKGEQELFSDALLDQAAGIVDAVYYEIYRMLRPGVTENQVEAFIAERERLGVGAGCPDGREA